MQNKPNPQNPQINPTLYPKKVYEDFPLPGHQKNKPNSNPIQANSVAQIDKTNPIQTQPNPISSSSTLPTCPKFATPYPLHAPRYPLPNYQLSIINNQSYPPPSRPSSLTFPPLMPAPSPGMMSGPAESVYGRSVMADHRPVRHNNPSAVHHHRRRRMDHPMSPDIVPVTNRAARNKQNRNHRNTNPKCPSHRSISKVKVKSSIRQGIRQISQSLIYIEKAITRRLVTEFSASERKSLFYCEMQRSRRFQRRIARAHDRYGQSAKSSKANRCRTLVLHVESGFPFSALRGQTGRQWQMGLNPGVLDRWTRRSIRSQRSTPLPLSDSDPLSFLKPWGKPRVFCIFELGACWRLCRLGLSLFCRPIRRFGRASVRAFPAGSYWSSDGCPRYRRPGACPSRWRLGSRPRAP